MPFSLKSAPVIAMSLFMFSLSGCGEKTVVGQYSTKSEQSESCIECHTNIQTPSLSPGTGAVITTEWKASVHNTKNGAGCADCHEPFNHPNAYCGKCHNGSQLVGADEIQRNPDRTGKCLKCHTRYVFPHSETNPESIPGTSVKVNSLAAHFNNILPASSAVYPPSYVTYEYTDKSSDTGIANNCRKCHNPHDPTTAILYNRDFARSAHGMTERLPAPTARPTDGATINWDGSFTIVSNPSIYDARIAPREESDFKAKGTTRTADQVSIEQFGCIRCHTTTGFINFVDSGFIKLNSFGPNNPATGVPYQSINPMTAAPKSELSPASSGKEVIGCNACHDNGSGISYDFKKLRKVAPVTVYYNYSVATGSGVPQTTVRIKNYAVSYPDAGDSNMCVVCHSGRLIGLNIKMASAKGLDYSKVSRTVSHYRGTAELTYQKGFEYYSSADKYIGAGNHYSHKDIGLNKTTAIGNGPFAGNSTHGPCIGCHLNSNGNETSTHTFMPVNREASSTYRPGYPLQNDSERQPDAITKIVSNACVGCHKGSYSLTPEFLDWERTKYNAATKAMREVLLYAMHTKVSNRTIDSEGRPAAPSATTGESGNNWYGAILKSSENQVTKDTLQVWLRTTSVDDYYTGTQGFIYPTVYGDALSGQLLQVKKAAYNLGAYFNFWMMYADPGGFAHNDVYAKRLMYDTIDWLDDGVLNNSVRETFESGLPKAQYASTASGTLGLKSRLTDLEWLNAYKYLLTSDATKEETYEQLISNKKVNSGRPLP